MPTGCQRGANGVPPGLVGRPPAGGVLGIRGAARCTLPSAGLVSAGRVGGTSRPKAGGPRAPGGAGSWVGSGATPGVSPRALHGGFFRQGARGLAKLCGDTPGSSPSGPSPSAGGHWLCRMSPAARWVSGRGWGGSAPRSEMCVAPGCGCVRTRMHISEETLPERPRPHGQRARISGARGTARATTHRPGHGNGAPGAPRRPNPPTGRWTADKPRGHPGGRTHPPAGGRPTSPGGTRIPNPTGRCAATRRKGQRRRAHPAPG
ncbi:hypothetical protein SAMN05216267_102549 [Actinacidiphila rubida]|uniref:Uncharacterized protein n=1 Tax=Actinacidiphila rubida TaxID=310780 RepID=A0A1H8PCE3_9ACTN|nr:hypothetical protein SAMN05216267_102549 [Actinacidiphila rubida]